MLRFELDNGFAAASVRSRLQVMPQLGYPHTALGGSSAAPHDAGWGQGHHRWPSSANGASPARLLAPKGCMIGADILGSASRNAAQLATIKANCHVANITLAPPSSQNTTPLLVVFIIL